MAFAFSYDRKPVMVVGPFLTSDQANAWALEHQTQTWITSSPIPCPSPDMLSWQVWQVENSIKGMSDLYKQIVALEQEKDARDSKAA